VPGQPSRQYRALVKAVDISGNDTTQAFAVEVG
jgi:hypothetical protein